MTRISILVGLISLHLGGAIDAPCATIAPLPAGPLPAGVSTTAAGISCNTPVCQGLVGAGVGVAGLAAIGGIIAAVTHHGDELLHTVPPPNPTTKAPSPTKAPTKAPSPTKAPTKAPPTKAPSPTKAPTNAPPTKPPSPATTGASAGPPTELPTTTKSPLEINIAVTTPSMRARVEDKEAEGSNWLLPLLIALFLLSSLLGIVGYFCMKPQKRTTKLKKKTAPAPAEPEEVPLIAPAPAPAGHWEQPMALVPELPAVVMPMASPSYIV